MMSVRETESVCPFCLKTVRAERVLRPDGSVVLVKKCPRHGEHREILWRGLISYGDWIKGAEPASKIPERDCAHCRGLCPSHERDTCCTLLEVTDRCNLRCRFCFADPAGAEDPSLSWIKAQIRDLTEVGKTFLQLSGGEPTVRDDLPEIIRFAADCGCRYLQLNTNGIRLAEEEGYAERLKEAGLDFVFLQFDGLDDSIYRALRGRELMSVKERCIERCGDAGLGVTLVPTVVPGINDHQVGSILRYGVSCSPVVRGVHYQPVSFFGRVPEIPNEGHRYTLDQLVRDLVEQAGELVKTSGILPSACDHPMCGFHGDFAVMPDGTLYSLSRRSTEKKCCCSDPASANREFVGRRWERHGERESASLDMTDMDTFLARVKSHGFTVTAMAFQDAGNLDTDRLRRCSLHVYREGRKIPFCAAYLSRWEEV